MRKGIVAGRKVEELFELFLKKIWLVKLKPLPLHSVSKTGSDLRRKSGSFLKEFFRK